MIMITTFSHNVHDLNHHDHNDQDAAMTCMTTLTMVTCPEETCSVGSKILGKHHFPTKDQDEASMNCVLKFLEEEVRFGLKKTITFW